MRAIVSARDQYAMRQCLRMSSQYDPTFTPSLKVDTPECASGQCEIVSDEYVEHLRRRGQEARTEEFNYPLKSSFPNQVSGWSPRKGDEEWANQWDGFHYAPVVDIDGVPHVVDWTMRQLRGDAKYPHVEPLDSYAKNFVYHNPRG